MSDTNDKFRIICSSGENTRCIWYEIEEMGGAFRCYAEISNQEYCCEDYYISCVFIPKKDGELDPDEAYLECGNRGEELLSGSTIERIYFPLKSEVGDYPWIAKIREGEYIYLRILTDVGAFDIVSVNEHNGYYSHNFNVEFEDGKSEKPVRTSDTEWTERK